MKKEDFVVGLWYKCKDWANSNDFCKGLEFDGDRVTFKEVITGGYYKNDKLNGWYTNNGDLEIASKTEYSKYLPEGHPDKLSDRYSNYKVGDYIFVSNRRNDNKQTMLIKQITPTCFMGATLEKYEKYKSTIYFHPDEVIRLTDDINIRKAFQDEIDELNDKIGSMKKGLITELKKDEYYLITYLRTGNNFLTKWNGTNQSGPRIEIQNKYYGIGGNWGDMSSDTHRISYATQEQIKWLDACITANKYVPLEEALKYKLTSLPKGEYFHITTKSSKRIVMGTGSDQCGNHISYEFIPASRPFYTDGKTARWMNDGDVDIRKATPDEIQWLDACIKAGTFIEKANTPRILPKVGDWVITADFSPHYDGKPLRINRITYGRYCYFDNSRDDSHNFNVDNIVRFCRADELLPKCSTPTATLVDTSLVPSGKKSMPELYRVYTTPTVKDPKVFTEPISLSILGTKLIPVKLIPERKKPELPKIIKINLLNTKKVVSLHP